MNFVIQVNGKVLVHEKSRYFLAVFEASALSGRHEEFRKLVQPKPAAAASCCTVPQATAWTVQVDKTLFTFRLVYFQNRTRLHTNLRSDIASI